MSYDPFTLPLRRLFKLTAFVNYLSVCFASVTLSAPLSRDFKLYFECICSGVGSSSNSVAGIDAMSPSSKEDFTEFENLLKEKISQFEKSVHYSSFLDSLFRELCISCKQHLLQ